MIAELVRSTIMPTIYCSNARLKRMPKSISDKVIKQSEQHDLKLHNVQSQHDLDRISLMFCNICMICLRLLEKGLCMILKHVTMANC